MTRRVSPDGKLSGWAQYGRGLPPSGYVEADADGDSDKLWLANHAVQFCCKTHTLLVNGMLRLETSSGKVRYTSRCKLQTTAATTRLAPF